MIARKVDRWTVEDDAALLRIYQFLKRTKGAELTLVIDSRDRGKLELQCQVDSDHDLFRRRHGRNGAGTRAAFLYDFFPNSCACRTSATKVWALAASNLDGSRGQQQQQRGRSMGGWIHSGTRTNNRAERSHGSDW